MQKLNLTNQEPKRRSCTTEGLPRLGILDATAYNSIERPLTCTVLHTQSTFQN